MASHVTSIESLAERPVTVDPEHIEEEFDRIWRESSVQGLDESSVRLRVINFVAVSALPGAMERFDSVMAALPQHHPCRGVLGLIEEGWQGLEASISAHCWRSGSGGRYVCSEQVLLRGGPGDERSLASSLMALLVPDVPLNVWLIGAPDERSYVVREVLPVADRVFLDSSDHGDALAMLQIMLHLHTVHRVSLLDLAWVRLATWRTLIAQFFDGNEGVDELQRLRSVEIVAGTGRVTSEALLLAGWLASRLGLTVADTEIMPGGVRATLYMGSQGVQVTVRADGRSEAPIHAVRLRTENAEIDAWVHAASGHIDVRETWHGEDEAIMVEPAPADDASLFRDALDFTETDVFAESARSAVTLFE